MNFGSMLSFSRQNRRRAGVDNSDEESFHPSHELCCDSGHDQVESFHKNKLGLRLICAGAVGLCLLLQAVTSHRSLISFTRSSSPSPAPQEQHSLTIKEAVATTTAVDYFVIDEEPRKKLQQRRRQKAYVDVTKGHRSLGHSKTGKDGKGGKGGKGKDGKSGKKSKTNQTATVSINVEEAISTFGESEAEEEEEENIFDIDTTTRGLGKKVDIEINVNDPVGGATATTITETEEEFACEQVDALLPKTLENHQKCLDYLALPYEMPICDAEKPDVVPKIFHSVSGSSNEWHHQRYISATHPHFRRNHLGDNEALGYVRDKCGELTAQAYECLQPPAYRADLFRFCALYAEGGIYLDSDILPLVPLEDLYSQCSAATIGHDIPQDYATGKQMKILAGAPGSALFKCAMEHIIDQIEARSYPEVGALAISGPLVLGECFEQYPENVAINYHDTRNARWPFTGLRRGTKILAYEVPNQARHLEKDMSNFYGNMFDARQVYSPTCKLKPKKPYPPLQSLSFTFPSPNDRVEYYMGSWYEQQSVANSGICTRNRYYNGTDAFYSVPQLFNAHNLGSSGANPFFEDVLSTLTPHLANPSKDLLLFHFGDSSSYYEDPVLLKARPAKWRETSVEKTPILVPLDIGEQYGILSQVVSHDTSWSKKRDSLVWRGASTGSGFKKRSPLVQTVNQLSIDRVDVKLHALVQGDENDESYHALLGERMTLKELLEHKYLLSLEGNDVAAGLKWMLYSESVVFMPKPRTVSWAMEDKLVPFYHYIPLADDLSDLEASLIWARENDEACRQISLQATQFVEQLWMSKKAREDTQFILAEMMGRYQKFYGSAIGNCHAKHSFEFPSVNDRLKEYMGTWYETRHVDATALCEEIKYYGDAGQHDLYSHAMLYNTQNLQRNPTNFSAYIDDMVHRLVPYFPGGDDAEPLFASHFGDEHVYYEFPVLVKARHIESSLSDKAPIIAPLEMVRHYAPLSLVEESDIPWEDKQEILVWRGATTGSGQRRRVDRIRFIHQNAAEWTPNIEVNVGFTELVHGADREFGIQDLVKPRMEMPEILSFKYLLSIEGNDVASNLKWLLYSNSVVFMPIPTISAWAMEDRLVPYYHYIPVAKDLTDLPNQIAWAQSHDEECRQIAKHATKYIEDLWMSDHAQQETAEISRALVERYHRNYGQVLHECPIPRFLQPSNAVSTVDPETMQNPVISQFTTNSSSIRNNTLVVVVGNLRCGELAWESLKHNVLDINSADLAMLVGETLPAYEKSSLFDRASFIWRFTEHEDWTNQIDRMEVRERARTANFSTGDASTLMAFPSWRDEILPRIVESTYVFGGVGKFRGSGAIQFVIRYYLQELIRELRLTDLYERFVIVRSDSFYTVPLNLTTLDNQFVWVPKGEDYGGVNDRQVIANSEDILKVLDGFPAMCRDPRHYTDWLLNDTPEHFLLDSWQKAGLAGRLRRYENPFYTCAMPGDQTATSVPFFMGADGVYVKHHEEYYSARDALTEGRIIATGDDQESICRILSNSFDPLLQIWNRDIMASRGVDMQVRTRNRISSWFERYLQDCSDPTMSAMHFSHLLKIFKNVVGSRGVSDDAISVCKILPRYARILVSHPHCMEDTISNRTNRVDSYELQCVKMVYKATFAKLRQAAANSMYLDMLSNMAIAKTSATDPLREECQKEFNSLFEESLAHPNGMPWLESHRIPQVAVGPMSNDRTENSAAVPYLRSIPLWSRSDLAIPFKQEDSNHLESPLEVAEFLEMHWRTFLSEVDQIPNDLWADPYPFLNPVEGGWGVYVLFKNRTLDEDRCQFTPQTCDLVRTILPSTKLPYFHPYNEEAGFFRMKPGSVIAPHSGPVNTIINTHIGLRGVDGAKFFVNDTEIRWKEGETFSFEDSYEHWGNHASDASEDRIIFMIRQMHPDVVMRHYEGHKRTQAGLIER